MRWLLRPAALLALLAATSCSAPAKRADPILPPAPTVVTVRMVEYHLGFDPRVPSGRVVFRVANDGQLPHSLWLVPLPASIPPIMAQLHGTKRIFLAPYAGVGELGPGQASSFAADLRSGQRYGLICFDQTPAGKSEALLGMASEFRTPQDSLRRGAATS